MTYKNNNTAPMVKRLRSFEDREKQGVASFILRKLIRHPMVFHDDVIQLHEPLWGAEDRPDFLFNRDFNKGVELAQEFLRNPTMSLVVGSKGIGKSCLGLVIVSVLLKSKAVVYEVGAVKLLIISNETVLQAFQHDEQAKIKFRHYEVEMVDSIGVFQLDSDLCERLKVLSSNVAHVVDVGEESKDITVTPNHHQIIISSPNSDKLKRFGDVNPGFGTIRYLVYSPWSLKELKTLNQQFPEDSPLRQTEDVLRAKFELFGGIPRQIFTGETAKKAMDHVLELVGKVSLEIWKSALLSADYTRIPKEVPGLFVSITESKADYKVYDICFASNFIAQAVIRRHAQGQRAELVSLLKSMDGPRRMLAFLQGYLLEEVMHAAILNDVKRTYSFRLLGDAEQVEPRDVTLPTLTLREFRRKDMSDIKGPMEENMYFRPTFPTFPSVESFAIVSTKVLFPNEKGLCILGFQATVSDKHKLNRVPLQKIQTKVKEIRGENDVLPIIVVFVCSQGKGISNQQPLGKISCKYDQSVRQGVLYGVDLSTAFIEGVGEVRTEEVESEEEEEEEEEWG